MDILLGPHSSYAYSIGCDETRGEHFFHAFTSGPSTLQAYYLHSTDGTSITVYNTTADYQVVRFQNELYTVKSPSYAAYNLYTFNTTHTTLVPKFQSFFKVPHIVVAGTSVQLALIFPLTGVLIEGGYMYLFVGRNGTTAMRLLRFDGTNVVTCAMPFMANPQGRFEVNVPYGNGVEINYKQHIINGRIGDIDFLFTGKEEYGRITNRFTWLILTPFGVLVQCD